MTINAHTRIGRILKENSNALEAIISISPLFEKLRNPFLRRIMAARTTLAMASKAGGCTVDDFYNKLEPLGFKIDKEPVKEKEVVEKSRPLFMLSLQKNKLKELDVREQLSSGTDPLSEIMSAVNELPYGNTLKIINTFEPAPLIQLLGKRGFEAYVVQIRHDLVETYFHKATQVENPVCEQQDGDFDYFVAKFEDSLQSVDVRQLAMPKPMITILDALNELKKDHALLVYHKRIPVFLLPELTDRGYQYRIKEVGDQVQILIFSKNNDRNLRR